MKRLLPAICLVLLIVSCAGDPAAQDDTLTQLPPEASSEPVETTTDDQTDVPSIPEESVAEEKPAVPAIPLSPEDESADYYYPEPELTLPESGLDETEPAIASREEPAKVVTPERSPAIVSEPTPAPESTPAISSEQRPVPDRAPAVVSEPSPAPERAPAVASEPKTKPVTPPPSDPTHTQKPAEPERPAAKERVVSGAAADIPDTTPPAEIGPVMPEDPVPDSVPELWADEIRSAEPPPPVVRTELVPSRSVSVPRDGFLEVWYPGTGWVYLGDASGLIGVAYETRKIENRDTLFTFRARRSGNYILEFSRYDVLTDEFMQDALSVTVIEPVPGKRTTVRAPDFMFAGTPDKDGASEEESDISTSTSVHDEPVLSLPPETDETVPVTVQNPREMLTEAQSRLASGDAPGALEVLDRFFEKALNEIDEGWYLRGQAYEANSASRNIRRALEAYETVVSAYPDSVRWKDADERIRYIKQFYFRVR